jgi:hypothetical protein
VYQDEAEHFSVELEAIAAFLRAALLLRTKIQIEASAAMLACAWQFLCNERLRSERPDIGRGSLLACRPVRQTLGRTSEDASGAAH